MKLSKLKALIVTASCVAIATVSNVAMAAGGMAKATTTMDDIRIWLYSIIAIAAIIYLLIQGLMAFMDRTQWSDFGMAVVKVAVVGGTPALALFAWGLFA